MKIIGCDNVPYDIEVNDQVKVLGRKNWYKVGSVITGTVWGYRWQSSKRGWNYEHVVVIPANKIYYAIHPLLYGGNA